jgi:UrcA family protein
MNHTKLISLGGAVAITCAGLFLMAPPASAKARIIVTAPAPSEIVSRHISYADLNLASDAGERTLNYRVGGAVTDLCSEATGGSDGSLAVKIASKRCGNVAWSQARPQISQATKRARDIALTGTSLIAATAITIVLPQ